MCVWFSIGYKAKTRWLGIRIMCLSMNCCFSELALYKSNSACWSRTKRTSSSSHWKLICSQYYLWFCFIQKFNLSVTLYMPIILSDLLKFQKYSYKPIWMSEWLLFNTNSAIFQLYYHGFEVKPKTIKMDICCFSAKHTALRRKSKDWLVRNQNNVSEWSDMSTVTIWMM
jgi:hypothetical protein